MFRPRLSNLTLSKTAAAVSRPAYDPESLAIGVVHFGPGAFHRAHQAAFFDVIAVNDKRWGICGVSLHSAGVRDALLPQEGLYTLAILDEAISYQVIGSVREILVAPENPNRVFQRLLQARIVTATVTEKGYCLTPDGTLDFSNSDIILDIANPQMPVSFIGYVTEGLRLRRERGLPPFMLIPCDNLPSNGRRLKSAVTAFAAKFDLALAAWIEAELQCPCTMVDSITPATDDALRECVAEMTGLEDAWPIQREAFTQWVIEDIGQEAGPDWNAAGVTLTDDVPAYERAKIRLLNGAHSTLAYVGLSRSYETVSQAMSDPDLALLVRDLMLEDVVPLLKAPKGLDLKAYSEAILKRFRNPAIRHMLSQIAWDGSQKLPIRILSSLEDALRSGQDICRLCLALAAWMRFVRAKAVAGEAIVDPLATELLSIGEACRDEATDVRLFLDLRSVFPESLAQNPDVKAAIESGYITLMAG